MTPANIIHIAREAGFVIDKESRKYQSNCISATHHVIDEPLTRFAALVAAAERSACAKVVEQAGSDGYGTLAAAAMIRARGEK